MKAILLRVPGLDPSEEHLNINSPFNIDNRLLPYILLRQLLDTNGYLLTTLSSYSHYAAVIDINVFATPFLTCLPHLCLALEIPEIHRLNNSIPSFYTHVATWRQDLIDNHTSSSIIPFPIPLRDCPNIPLHPQMAKRPNLISFIYSNKSLNKVSDHDGYFSRFYFAKYLQSASPESIAIYGSGWSRPFVSGVRPIRLVMRIVLQLLGSFKSYLISSRLLNSNGFCSSKSVILSSSRFSLAFENSSYYPHYITEKLFDSLMAGCVPVYWGHPLPDSIPRTLYINAQDFPTATSLYNYIQSCNTDDYFSRFYSHLKHFFESSSHRSFTADEFSRRVSKIILNIIDSP